jgi:hypothetical protein
MLRLRISYYHPRLEHRVNDSKVPGALKHLATVCGSGSCPTLYETDRGTYVVQGYVVGSDAGVQVPAGASLVEIPAELLAEAIRTLR